MNNIVISGGGGYTWISKDRVNFFSLLNEEKGNKMDKIWIRLLEYKIGIGCMER